MNATVNAVVDDESRIFLRVSPFIINIINAVVFCILSILLFVAPKRFMVSTYFNNVPVDSRDRVFYLVRFLALVYFGGMFVPVFFGASFELLCAQAAFLHGFNHIHTWIRLCPPGRSYYKNTMRYDGEQDGPSCIGMSTLFSAGLCLANALAVRENPSVDSDTSTYVSVAIANIISLIFSSVFAVGFTLFPERTVQLFWSKGHMVNDNVHLTHNEKWWFRCIGLTIISLNMGLAVDRHIHHEIFRLQNIVILSGVSLMNILQICTRHYRNMARVWLWLFCTVTSVGVITVNILSFF